MVRQHARPALTARPALLTGSLRAGSLRAGSLRASSLRAASLVLAIALCGTMGACQTSASRADADGPVFPEAKAQEEVLDIQVVRDGTHITLTNTTARAYGRSRLWLNRWFSRDIEALDIGQSLTFPLSEFRDRFDEPFRAGGFFATRRPTRLVQAQLETADSLLGLVVVARGEEN